MYSSPFCVVSGVLIFTSLLAGLADLTTLQSAVWATFVRYQSLTGVAPVEQGRSVAACQARRLSFFPAAVAFRFIHAHFTFTGLSSCLTIFTVGEIISPVHVP
jgi:hypothetical protein